MGADLRFLQAPMKMEKSTLVPFLGERVARDGAFISRHGSGEGVF